LRSKEIDSIISRNEIKIDEEEPKKDKNRKKEDEFHRIFLGIQKYCSSFMKFSKEVCIPFKKLGLGSIEIRERVHFIKYKKDSLIRFKFL